MTIRFRATIARWALCSAVISAHAAEVPNEIVHFEINYVTAVGQSVFVLGDVPQLGGDDITRAVKLVPGDFSPGSLPWRIDIAIPQGTEYTWRFVLRSDAVSELSKAANGSDLTAAQIDSTTAPTPPTRDLVAYTVVGDGATQVRFNLADGVFVYRPLRPVPDHAILRVAVLGDQPFGPGIDGQILATLIDTDLHTIYYSFGSLYNYVPAGSSEPLGVKTTLAVPSAFVPSTRTVNGVTGRGIQVWTPRHYGIHAERRYPVLYMHDGQNVFQPGGPFGSWNAENVAGQAIKWGRVRELIIVAIDNASNRLTEYNPEWGSSSDNEDYNRFLVEELKPYIDAAYRTQPEPEHTGVLGSSFGGVASLSAGFAHPEVFGRVGAMSTSFWASTFDDQLAAGELPLSTRLYLDAGDLSDDTLNTILARDGALEAGRVLGDTLHFTIGYGQGHNEAAWAARLGGALAALFPVTEDDSTIDLPAPIVADVDGSGCVDLSDLGVLLASYAACSGQTGYDAGADLDASGCIDLSDLGEMLAEYRAGCE